MLCQPVFFGNQWMKFPHRPDDLIVDDQISAAQLLIKLLELHGYQAWYTTDWDHLTAEIQTYQPSLIILDMHLSSADLDGLKLLNEIRAHPDPQVSSVRVLVVSAFDYSHRIVASGADGFVLKPFKFDSLMASIREIEAAPANRKHESEN